MDLNDFWQENKRWLLGCVAGLLVFLIAKSVIGNVFDADGGWRAVRSVYNNSAKEERYQQTQLDAAKDDRDILDERLAVLRAAMHYELPTKFDLADKGDPELQWPLIYGVVRDAMFNLAYEENVDFPESSFTWGQPVGREAIQRGLISVSLVEHSVRQLIAAHKKVTERDFDALGVRSIESFHMDRGKATGRQFSRRTEGPRAQDYVDEVKVGFKFEADNAAVQEFLENCKAAEPRIGLRSFKIVHGRLPGSPLKVSGEVVAVILKPVETE